MINELMPIGGRFSGSDDAGRCGKAFTRMLWDLP
jgi:hypothetical protein